MENQSEPPPHANENLAETDAKAFLIANKLLPDQKEPAPAAPPVGTTGEEDLITLAISQAQQIRAESHRSRPATPYIYIVIAVVLVLIIGLGLAHLSAPQNAAGNTSTGVLMVPTPASSDTNDLPSQAQQQINTCSNPVNAVLGAC